MLPPRKSCRVVSGASQHVWIQHKSPPTPLITAAATPGTAAATAAPAAAAAAPSALGARLGFVDRQRAAARVLAVQGRDRGLGLLLGLHLHEAKALGTAGVPVHDYLR